VSTATQVSEAAYRPVPLECRLRQYLEAIKPFQQMRYKLYSVMLPTTIIYPDGRIEREYNFTEQQKESLRLADEAMEMIKRRMGLVPNV
jgi:hypothetical protein